MTTQHDNFEAMGLHFHGDTRPADLIWAARGEPAPPAAPVGHKWVDLPRWVDVASVVALFVAGWCAGIVTVVAVLP